MQAGEHGRSRVLRQDDGGLRAVDNAGTGLRGLSRDRLGPLTGGLPGPQGRRDRGVRRHLDDRGLHRVRQVHLHGAGIEEQGRREHIDVLC